MRKEVKAAPTPIHPHASSLMSLLSGWVQQGVESFFATQRILLDLALRQSASAVKSLREGLGDAHHSPVSILSDTAVEGTANFIEAQRILLNLAQRENEIVMNGVKERVEGSNTAVVMTELMGRSLATFIDMQQEFLKITSKQTIGWLEAAKAGKHQGNRLVDFAREAMDNFVRSQKKFLDVVAEETVKLTRAKAERPEKKNTHLSELAREATIAFIDAQKKLLDVAGQQMNVNLKAASRTMDMMTPFRLLPLANLTGEGVKNFVDAEKAMIDSMMKPPRDGVKRARPTRTTRRRATARAAAA